MKGRFTGTLHGLWLIDADSGICIFNQEFSSLPNDIDENLIGGFFTAIESFSKEVTGENIKSIELESINLHLRHSGALYLALATTGYVERQSIEQFLDSLAGRFQSKYGDIIDEKGTGNVTFFENFAKDVEEEIGKKSKRVTIMEGATGADSYEEAYQKARERLSGLESRLARNIASIADKTRSISKYSPVAVGKRLLGLLKKKSKENNDD